MLPFHHFQLVLGILIAIAYHSTLQITTAEDWPTFRANPSRSGYTSESFPNQLRLRWTYRESPAPRLAWPSSGRMRFDEVCHPILIGDWVLFGSSVEDQVVAIHATTGKVGWTFSTEGPIRFAPVGWRDRVLVASDDGWLYALSLDSGRLLWKHRGGPDDRKVIGNERVISHWPARGGPVVIDETVYFAAGIWPSDGVFLHALDAESGEVLWTNGRTGGLEMDQPHGGARAKSGVSAQGYLLANDTQIIVPTGRSVPAAFRRSDGKFLYYHLQKNQHRGGSRCTLSDRFFVNSGCLFDQQSGDLSSQIGMGAIVSIPGGVLRSEGKSLSQYRWTDSQRIDRKGKTVARRSLEKTRLIPCQREVLELIVAGSDVVCGEEGRVCAIDYTAQRNTWWAHEVDGKALGLAYGNGRLVVSTDQGVIYCFDGDDDLPPNNASLATKVSEASSSPSSSSEVAKQILEKSGIRSGFCVDLGCGDGELALELARQSKLNVYAIESDEEQVAAARKRIEEAGFYGSRVTVLLAEVDHSSLPAQFANLVVSSRSLTLQSPDSIVTEAKRLQRPFGGVVCMGNRDEMQVDVRGELPGSGSWTHQNADAANTVCSMDQIVKGPLEMFWFRDVPFEVPNRHGQGPAPLFHRGIMVVGGVNGLCALDAYNGHTVWTYQLPGILKDFDGIHHDVGVGETGSNFCIGDDSVYVRHHDQCVRIDLQSGEVKSSFSTPVSKEGKHRVWGYLAYHKGTLFGSVSNEQHTVSPRYKLSKLYPESVLVFAIDPTTGKLKWKHRPGHSIRNNSIAIGNDSMTLIDRPLVMEDRITQARRGGKHRELLKSDEMPDAELIALDLATGKVRWRQDEDVFGTQLSISEQRGVILMYFQAVRHRFFKLPSEIGGRLAAFDLANGKMLWSVTGDYKSRPLIRESTLFAQGGAWDIYSGRSVPFPLERSYGCGQISASANLMLFRSGTLGYLDSSRTEGTENYGGIRLSCWINAIPAGGLVLIPDGSAKCQCSYPMQAWFALRERQTEEVGRDSR